MTDTATEQIVVQQRGSVAGTITRWSIALAALMLLAIAGITTWRWLDRNVVHWGVDQATVEQVDSTRLLEQVRAFEVVSVKESYAGSTTLNVSKKLSAGPVRVGLPGWAAGQRLDVKGKVRVAAGTDLSGVGPDDMEVTRNGNTTTVVVHIPAPELLSTEILPETFDVETSEGFLDRAGGLVGIDGADLRDRAADQITNAGRDAALKNGILDTAARNAEQQLQQFLSALPQPAGQKVSYVVVARRPAVQ